MFDSIKNASKSFFYGSEDETGEGTPMTETPKNDTPVQQVSEQPIQQFQQAYASNVGGIVEQKYVDKLQQAIASANMEGIDFYEFTKALDSNTSMNGQAKYETTFAILSATSNVTKDKLLSSASHYLNVLEKERETFDVELSNQVSLNVTTFETNLSEKEKSIIEKENKIKELQEEINKERSEMISLQSTIQQNRFNLDVVKNNFALSLASVKSNIDTHITNITNFLK